MMRISFIIPAIFYSMFSIAQSITFSQTVNNLFFGVDISNQSISLINSLHSAVLGFAVAFVWHAMKKQ